jgi:hypothetical protein
MDHSDYASEDIDYQLHMKGSKFSQFFCDNPRHLLEVLREEYQKKQIESFWSEDRCEFQIRFLRTEFPKGIGEDRVVHIDEVPGFVKESFAGKDLETLHSIVYKAVPKLTWTVNIILQIIDSKPEILSVFPGIYAPPFPNIEEQDEGHFAESMEFWCKHIIIA